MNFNYREKEGIGNTFLWDFRSRCGSTLHKIFMFNKLMC